MNTKVETMQYKNHKIQNRKTAIKTWLKQKEVKIEATKKFKNGNSKEENNQAKISKISLIVPRGFVVVGVCEKNNGQKEETERLALRLALSAL